jgi:hypothetical protein
MKYDRRFDLRLRQDVKDWAKQAGISEQEALLDVLEQRRGAAAGVSENPRTPPVDSSEKENTQ